MDDVDGAVLDQADVFGDAGEHLAGGDGGVERVGQLGVAFGVVSVQRLLDPDQVELFEDPAEAHGGGSIPLLIGVDHERDIVADMLADGAHALDVDLVVRLADFDLDATDAVGQ